MNEPITFGLIGCGTIGEALAEGVDRVANAELLACVDVDREKAVELGKLFDVDHVSTDHATMLREMGPDAAIVATPSGTHSRITIDCADVGVHVLCQKPLDVSVERMDAMIEACEENDVKLGGLYNTRFMEGSQRTMQLLEAGAIGDIVLANGVLPAYRDQDYYDSATWRGTLDMDGGCLMNQGIHTVDRLAWFNDGIERVYADLDTIAHEMEAEDVAAVEVRFGNGSRGTITATTASPDYPAYDRIDLHGESGYISVTPSGIFDAEFEDPDSEIDLPGGSDFVRQIEDMAAAILEDREPMITGREARHAPDSVLAMYDSARRDEPVTVSEFLERTRSG